MQTVNVMMKQASLTRFEAAEPKRPRPEQKSNGTAPKPSGTAKRRRRNTLVFGFSYKSFFGDVASVKRFLKNKKTDVNQVDETGQTPLYVSCQEGHVDVVLLLLARKDIQINLADVEAKTPLYIACAYGHVDIVRLLLAQKEIQINQADEDGRTPLYVSCEQGHVDVVRLLLARKEIQINLAMDGATPLTMACAYGHVDVVRLLLARKEIQINQAMTEDGATPLHATCQNGHANVVRLLLARKEIQINQAMTDGRTPLYITCQEGHVDVLRLLLAFVKWETREQGNWVDSPSWAQAAFSTFYVRNEWPDNLINHARLIHANGKFSPTQFDNITSFPTTTFQLTGFNLFTQDNGIQCPVRCLPCKHVFNAADLHQNRTFSNKCPSCNKVPTRIALMSEIEIKRWNYMESQEKKGEVHIDKLREQEKALQNERVQVQAAVDANNFQHRYRQFIKHT